MTDTYATIRSVLTGSFLVPETELGPGVTLEQLELDSLALAEFALILDERLGVRIDSERATRTATLAEVTEYVETLRTSDPVTAP
ncbi:acyl carrier protein [Streptomyces sp. NPDC001118]|uniref:acyl carrier protein n=1 Tax=unclassified Streptomyces TaxID=2593676 RepID=UPI00331CE3C0